MMIHQFGKKLLQESVFSRLKEYIIWQSEKGETPKFAPISINLDLTTACNFKCPHCIDGEIINTRKMLDLNYVKTLIRDWAGQGLKSVILIGGGEPVLYPHFEEVVRFLKDFSLQVGIVSNGTNIKKIENICHLLGKKDWVRLSLDAGINATFQKIHQPRVPVTLESIMTAVKRMRQKNKNFQMGFSFLVIGDHKKVNNVALVKNIQEIMPAAKIAKASGFSYLSLKPFISPEGERSTTISKSNLAEIKQEVKKAKALENENFKVVESINLLCFYDKDLKKMMQKQPRMCHAQFFRSIVIPAGVFGCSLWRGFQSTKISQSNQKLDKNYYYNLYQNRGKLTKQFDAKKNCQSVSCLYAPLNCWIEDLIKSPAKIKKLQSVVDVPDFFF
ncbi:MAG: radical SAM protein [Candidatus Nealsonbacteria bacterium]